MRDDDIDRAIDDIARELTAGEPHGAFRARVMARIESGESRRGWSTWVLSPLPVAALILVALAAAWSYRSPKRLALHLAETIALQRDERPVVASAPVAPTARRVEREATKGARAFHASARRVAPSDVAGLAPPLLNVPSIVLAPIDRGDSIQLQQLEPIAPIDVAPLGVEQP
jgi:hypothetical protein